MTSTNRQQGFLRLSEILKLIPVSKSTWWDGCKAGRYPKPIKIAPNATAWKAEDIYNLMESLENSDASQPKAGE